MKCFNKTTSYTKIIPERVMKEVAANISINPDIRFGKPCITGRRIAVADILQWLASGMLQEEILNDYPAPKRPYSCCT
jgi:uncharacterized protein (DUF433 family)